MAEKIAVPRTTEAATALLEQVATIDGDISDIEGNRTLCIADVNKRCDTALTPLLEQRAALVAALEAWWSKHAEALTEGKRKSIELGGCMIGTAKQRESLSVNGDEEKIAKALEKRPWATGLTRTKLSLEKAAILKVIAGKYRKQLQALGLGRKGGDDQFFVKRVEQQGTRA